jgi:hypothetical protein
MTPPPSLTTPARLPVDLPARALSQREVEIYWGRDRTNLRQCVSQLEGLAAWATLTPERS